MSKSASDILDSAYSALAPRGVVDGVVKFLAFHVLIFGLTHLLEVRVLASPGVTWRSQIKIVPLVSTPFILLVMFAAYRQEKLMNALGALARTDQLTGLPNRRAFLNDLNHICETAEGLPGLLAILDIDDFKRINDTLGHDAGDSCLVSLAQLMQRSCDANVNLCRLGGEEFALFIPDRGVSHAQEICAALCHGFHWQGVEDRVTVSAGLTWLDQRDPLKDAMHRADQALYQAKRSGKARAYLWPRHCKSETSGEEFYRASAA